MAGKLKENAVDKPVVEQVIEAPVVEQEVKKDVILNHVVEQAEPVGHATRGFRQ
jgi:hypothetical protein